MKRTSKPHCTEAAIARWMSEARGVGWMDVCLHVLVIRAYPATAYTGNGVEWPRTAVPIDGTGEWPYQLLWHSCAVFCTDFCTGRPEQASLIPATCKHPHVAYAVEGGVLGNLTKMGKSDRRLLGWRASSMEGNVTKTSSNHGHMLFLD